MEAPFPLTSAEALRTLKDGKLYDLSYRINTELGPTEHTLFGVSKQDATASVLVIIEVAASFDSVFWRVTEVHPDDVIDSTYFPGRNNR